MKKLVSIDKYVKLLAGAALVWASTASYATGNDLRKFVVSMDAEAGAIIAESQKMAADGQSDDPIESVHKVSLLEEFRSDDKWFHAVSAENMDAVDAYLTALNIEPTSVYESLTVNSPELGGGPKAGETPREGHDVYMIQRSIPGIGLAPEEKQVAISQGSQKVIESLGDALEWDHSFLTSEGTFCVYRAGDPEMIKEHAKIAGVPADPITKVEHIVRNYDFSK